MKKIILLIIVSLFSLQACMTQDAYTGQNKVNNTTKGAGLGALGGALVGVLTADNAKDRRKNALIGAGIGAVGGGGVGYYMDRQETQLRNRLRSTGVSVTRQGNNIILNMPGNITFGSGKSDIKPGFYGVLNSVSVVLKEFNQTGVNIAGHTDSTGSDSLNQKLSNDRANSVLQYLAGQGVAYGRLRAYGYGESQPIASNNTDAGRAQNRRVEITLSPM
jgi:outer membrane protein OmpA-like peptidoglycan-associated protein